MITSFEVGAVFKIINEASPALRKILGEIRALNKAIEGARANASALMKTLGAGTDAAVGETRALAAEWRSVAAQAKLANREIRAVTASNSGAASVRPRLPSGGARGRGGSGGFGPHYNPSGIAVPGGHIGFRGGGAAMAAGGALAYGAFMASQNESDIWQMLFHSGLPDTEGNRKKFADIVKEAHSLTGGNLEDIRAAAIDEIRMFRGTPGGGLGVLPEMLRAAATEAKAKGHGTTIDTAMESLIGLAHMTKEYSPEEIKKLAPVFGFLSSSTAATLPQIERAASYAVPILQSGLEIDPMQTLLMGIGLQRAGITNTKSGTWIRNMALNSLPGTSLMSKTGFKRHEESLHALGLIDKNDQPTWFTNGKPDLIKMLQIAGKNASGISLVKRGAYEKALFGTQGFGAFAVLSDPKVMAQLKALSGDMPGFSTRYKTYFQDYTGASTSQQAHKSFADFQDTLIEIGNNVLPPVNVALKNFDAVLKSLQGILPKGIGKKDDAWAKVGGAAVSGAALGTGAGLLFGGIGAIPGAAIGGALGGGLEAGKLFLELGSATDKTKDSASQAIPFIEKLSRAISALGAAASGAGIVPQNYVPAAPAGGEHEKHSDIIMDGDKVGKVIMRRVADATRRPLQGSAYHDGTMGVSPNDAVFSRG